MKQRAQSLKALIALLDEEEALFVAATLSEYDDGFIPLNELRDRQQRLIALRRAALADYRRTFVSAARPEVGVRIVRRRISEDHVHNA